MATKKAASTKKSAAKKPATKKQSTTKVTTTTVRAVEAEPEMTAAIPASTTKSSRSSLASSPIVAALIAEFIGTFVFAATILAGQGQPILVFFALVGVVLMVGPLSGGYVNPALTVAAWVTRRLSAMRALGYIVAQVLGGMLALVVLNMYVGAAGPSSSPYGAAASLFKASPVPAGKEWLVLLAEVIGAVIFGFAVANATRIVRDRTATAFTVGLGVFLGLMVAGSAAAMLGGSAILNPAVAVALQAGFGNIWTWIIYVLGASLGAIFGFGLHDLLRKAETE